jgi:hypothetical protein
MKHLRSYTIVMSLLFVLAFVLEVVAGPGFSGRSGGSSSFSSGRSSSFSSGRSSSYSSPSYSRPSYSSPSYSTSKSSSSGSSWFSSSSGSSRQNYFTNTAKAREVAVPATNTNSYSTGYKKELPVQSMRKDNTYTPSSRNTYIPPTHTTHTTTREVYRDSNDGFVDNVLKWTMISSLMHRDQPQVVVAAPATIQGNPAVVGNGNPGTVYPVSANTGHGFMYYFFMLFIFCLIAFILRVKGGR